MTIEVMLDLETLGVHSDSAIVSIGAVKFDPRGTIGELTDLTNPEYQHFHCAVSMHSLTTSEFHIDGQTVAWWMGAAGADGPSQEARDALLKNPADIMDVLSRFYDWFGGESLPVWGNGAGFDNVLLRNAYEKFDSQPPWKFRDDRCFRTLKALFPHVPYVRPVVPHDALQDAMAQAVHVQKLFNRIIS